MNSIKNKKALLIVTLFATAFSLIAQDNDISLGALITDRPDQTESPNAVPKGFFQVETGAFFESFEKNSIKPKLYFYTTWFVLDYWRI